MPLLHGAVAVATTVLHLVAVDAGGAAGGGAALGHLVAAIIVDVEDVEAVDQTRDEPEDRQENVDDEVLLVLAKDSWGRAGELGPTHATACDGQNANRRHLCLVSACAAILESTPAYRKG